MTESCHKSTCHLSCTWELKVCSFYTLKYIFCLLSQVPDCLFFWTNPLGSKIWSFSSLSSKFLPPLLSLCQTASTWETYGHLGPVEHWHCSWLLSTADQSKNCILKAGEWSEDSFSPKHKWNILTSGTWFSAEPRCFRDEGEKEWNLRKFLFVRTSPCNHLWASYIHSHTVN